MIKVSKGSTVTYLSLLLRTFTVYKHFFSEVFIYNSWFRHTNLYCTGAKLFYISISSCL